MNKFVASRLRQQEKVNVYFQAQSSYWKDIYGSEGVQGQVIRDRHTAALDWIESLALAPGSHVLEIGCGAGFMALTLAQRGFQVHAIDSSEAMVELARRHAAEAGMADVLSLDVGDVYALTFEDDCFDLVIAIGVIAWLGQPELAMQEMARVTKPGGHVILTAANRAGLHSLLDPWLNPALSPLKRSVKDTLERVGLRHWSPSMTSHDRRFIDKAVEGAELVKISGRTVGFGPFSLFRRTILPEPLGTALHQRLQRLADQDMPIFRSTGMSYLVLAEKPASRPLGQSTSVEEAISVVTKHYDQEMESSLMRDTSKQLSTQQYLRLISVPELPPLTSPFDPGYDPVTLESHLDQSAHLMASLKISMACWMIADEAATRRKIAAARSHHVPTVTGGGPFEVAVAQGQLEAYLDLCADLGVTRIECGEGFTTLSLKPREVVKMAHERGLAVQYEMGKKHEGPFTSDTLEEAIAQGRAWLDAGAEQLVVEARESARGVGAFDKDGSLNPTFVDRFAQEFGLEIAMFEAPNKASQFALLEHFGRSVHLCNVRLEELLRVEIFRRGLHSDAFAMPNLRPARPAYETV